MGNAGTESGSPTGGGAGAGAPDTVHLRRGGDHQSRKPEGGERLVPKTLLVPFNKTPNCVWGLRFPFFFLVKKKKIVLNIKTGYVSYGTPVRSVTRRQRERGVGVRVYDPVVFVTFRSISNGRDPKSQK